MAREQIHEEQGAAQRPLVDHCTLAGPVHDDESSGPERPRPVGPRHRLAIHPPSTQTTWPVTKSNVAEAKETASGAEDARTPNAIATSQAARIARSAWSAARSPPLSHPMGEHSIGTQARGFDVPAHGAADDHAIHKGR